VGATDKHSNELCCLSLTRAWLCYTWQPVRVTLTVCDCS